MIAQKHLLKTSPRYTLVSRDYTVKLLKVFRGGFGLYFRAEILTGKDKGKWTIVHKNDLEKIKWIKYLKEII